MPRSTTPAAPAITLNDEFIEALAAALAERLNGTQAVSAAPTVEPDEPDEEEEYEDEEEEEEDEDEIEDKYSRWSDAKLRRECIKRDEWEDEAIAQASRKDLLSSLRGHDAELAAAESARPKKLAKKAKAVEPAEPDEVEEEEEEAEAESGYTEEELSEMSLAQLKKAAREQGHSQADLRGLDEDGLIDLILEGQTTEVEEEAEEDEEEEEAEQGELTLEQFIEMGENNRDELIAEAEAWGVEVKKGARIRTIAQAIIDAAQAEYEEEEEEEEE